jgi:hypothetical protein
VVEAACVRAQKRAGVLAAVAVALAQVDRLSVAVEHEHDGNVQYVGHNFSFL